MTGAAPLVIVGDVLLDIDVEGRADRRSPDGPVPVVDVTTTTHRPGGAGLAATLAAHCTEDVVLVAGFADDECGDRLRALLSPRVELVELPFAGSTVCKQRVRAVGPCAGGESGLAPITRLDFGHGRTVAGPVSEHAQSVLANARAVLVADYGRGAAAHPQIRALLERRSQCTPLIWDPHPKGPRPVPAADLVTPNRSEAEQLVPDSPGFGACARELARRWSARAVTITLGADGAVLTRAGWPEAVHIPVPATESGPTAVHDTCGAGDRFAIAATVAMGAGADAEDAVRQAVAAASAFVADGAAAAFAETTTPIPTPELAGSDPYR